MTLAIEPPAALLVYGAALRRTAAGDPAPLHAIDGTGRRVSFDPAAWCGPLHHGDAGLLAHLACDTLDVP